MPAVCGWHFFRVPQFGWAIGRVTMSRMRVRVLFFGMLKEFAGKPVDELDLR